MIALGTLPKDRFVFPRTWFAVALSGALSSASALTVSFDYSLDSNNFFGSAGSIQRTILETAGSFFATRIEDSLGIIDSSGVNHFNVSIPHPGTGGLQTINDFDIGANTLIIFAGGRDLAGATLGQGGPGGFSASGTAAFINTLNRGQGIVTGPSAHDFAPWGGALSFDTVGTNWFFDTSLNTASDQPAGTNDFFSVALHELGHVLGIGTADSWDNLLAGLAFTGAAATAANGGTNPAISAGGSHWAAGTVSAVNGAAQEAAMDPDLTTGTRKQFTALDEAGLKDIGWQVVAGSDPAPKQVPLPPLFLALTAAGLVAIAATRRVTVNADNTGIGKGVLGLLTATWHKSILDF